MSVVNPIVKIGWEAIVKPLLGLVLLAALGALIYVRGMADGAAGVYDKQLTEMVELAKVMKENADKAITAGIQEAQEAEARKDFFDDAKTEVSDFYAKRAVQRPETTHETPDPVPCTPVFSFDADELRLFNQGNKASDFDLRR